MVAPAAVGGGVAAGVGIRLLGPVEVGGERGSVDLGGPRLRTLFGLLALRAPRVVSRDALVDGVWGHRPSAQAAATLRAHVAYLRRRLAAAGCGGLIATRAPGYALVAVPELIDVHQFENSVEKGRSELAAGAFEECAQHLAAALRLWRGEVLADCASGDWVRAEAARLREIRLYATEELLAARIALGQYAGVAAELEYLVQRHPLRERMWELLMLALYRTGRRAEALNTYRRARSRLIEEVGVEPGRRLLRLEAAILAGEEPQQGQV